MSLRWSSATDQLYAVSNSSPSLDLDFASNKSLLDNISGNNLVTFSRASTGTYVGSDGLIKTSPVNYALNSEQADLWALSSGSISANFAESPIGDLTADKWIPNTASNFHYPKLVTTLSSSSSVTYSIYAKQAGYRYLLLNTTAGSASGNAGPVVDLQDGVVVGNFAATYPTTVTDAGNGWWRVAMTFTGTGTNAVNVDHNSLPTSTIAAYAGDGTSGVLFWGAQLEEGTTATTYIPTTTTISGAPRFDHDPVTGESLGLLIEEARTNKMLNSGTTAEMVTTGGTTRTSGGFAAPDGSTDASRVDIPAVTGANIIRIITEQLGSLPANTNHTASIYLKGVNGGELVYLTLESTTPTSFVAANLTNEWQRFDITGLSSGSGLLFFNVGVDTRGGTGQTNQPAQSFFAWGAQVEEGSFPTSYIPTTALTVTRAADVASITGTNFSSWYNQSEGTVFADASAANAAINQYIFHTYGASPNNNRSAYYLNSSNRPSAAWINNGTTQALLQSPTPVSGFEGAAFKYVAAYNTNDFVVGYNGGSFIYLTSGTPDPTINVAKIGSFGGGIYILNGHISRLAYYPYRLADATLQEITS